MELWLTPLKKEDALHPDLSTEIERLRRASCAELRQKHQEVFGEASRCRHREHLFRRIAWRLQALAEGDLSQRARRRAAQIARDADLRINAPRSLGTRPALAASVTGRPRDPRLPEPGTVLTRQWKGRTVMVEVLADGFRFDSRHYTSLSAIAVAITGTRWNGLAFFGLTAKVVTPVTTPKGARRAAK